MKANTKKSDKKFCYIMVFMMLCKYLILIISHSITISSFYSSFVVTSSFMVLVGDEISSFFLNIGWSLSYWRVILVLGSKVKILLKRSHQITYYFFDLKLTDGLFFCTFWTKLKPCAHFIWISFKILIPLKGKSPQKR